MCTLGSIRLTVRVFRVLKGIFALYIFAIGCVLAASTDFQQAFGVIYVQYGLSLIFLALLSFAMIIPFSYGVDRHNRFLLMFVFVMETIVFAELINYGITINSYTVPEFPKDLQVDCLRNVPAIYSPEECAPFYNSDRTAGFRLVWESYFTKKSQKASFQVLTSIGEGFCCGFFQPFKCTANPDKFPSNRLTTGIDGDLLKARVQCSSFANYYPERDNCKDVEDYSTDPPTIGGCRFDLAAGNCLTKTVLEPSSIGCASFVEDWVVDQISTHSIVIGLSSVFNFFYMTLACCMWWKRKEADVFPTILMAGSKNAIKYRDVKAQYELNPHPGLLVDEGFLPKVEEGAEDTDGSGEEGDIEASVQS